MDIQTKLLIFAVDLVGPLLLGYASRYQRRVGDDFFNKMILNNIFVVCPVVSFLSFWVMPLTRELFWMPFLSLALGFVPGVAAWWLARRKYRDHREQGAYVMSASLANLGTIGGICVYLVYGEQGYGYQQIATLFQYVLMFAFCYPLAQYYERQADGRSGKKVSFWSMMFSKNQIAVVGILMGGALQMAGIPRPAELSGVTPFFIHSTHSRGVFVGFWPNSSVLAVSFRSGRPEICCNAAFTLRRVGIIRGKPGDARLAPYLGSDAYGDQRCRSGPALPFGGRSYRGGLFSDNPLISADRVSGSVSVPFANRVEGKRWFAE